MNFLFLIHSHLTVLPFIAHTSLVSDHLNVKILNDENKAPPNAMFVRKGDLENDITDINTP